MRKIRIGLTDTYYEQIRVIIHALGGEPQELVQGDLLSEYFTLPADNPLGCAKPPFHNQPVNLHGTSVAYWTVPLYEKSDPLDSYIVAAKKNSGFSPISREFLRPLINLEQVAAQVARLDGLIIAGGEDVNPLIYDVVSCGSREQHRTRDIIELAFISEALQQRKPILAICRGCQVLAVALGEQLIQDIPSYYSKLGNTHGGATEPQKSQGHLIAVHRDSPLSRHLKLENNSAPSGQVLINVNSYHHQAVAIPTKVIDVQATAMPPDGLQDCMIVEGFVAPFDFFVVGAQWHPERPHAPDDGSAAMNISDWPTLSARWRPHDRALFESFMAAASC